MKYLYFLKYNNICNRIVKRETSLAGYLGLNGANVITYIQDAKLWNPNDGITAVITTPNNMDFSIEPDYLLAVNESNQIESKWFITENIRWHKGQYQCHLKRDVLAEAWDELMQATCQIDRAIVSKYDKLIYNAEPITVNQLITEEWELKDKTGCPWIVFYAKDKPSINITMPKNSQSYADTTTKTKAQFEAEHTFTSWSTGTSNWNGKQIWVHYNVNAAPADIRLQKFLLFDWNNTWLSMYDDPEPYSYWQIYSEYMDGVYPNNVLTRSADFDPTSTTTTQLAGALCTYIQNTTQDVTFHNVTDYYNTRQLDGKTIWSSTDNKAYRVHVNYTYSAAHGAVVNTSAADDLWIKTKTFLETYTNCNGGSSSLNKGMIRYKYHYYEVTTTLVEVGDYESYTIKLPTVGTTTDGSPYNMWCMPYGDITVKYLNNNVVTTDADLNLRAANAIMDNMSVDAVYDMQILPYCPLPEEVILPTEGGSIIDIPTDSPYANGELTDSNTMRDDNNNIVGYIFACPNCTFKRQILLDEPITVDDIKLRDMTEIWRLYAPNYGSSFEFSVAKNNGLTGFTVRCTYMPINPYIRVAPIWGGLYGDYYWEDEPRGLICQGDYSLARTQSAWVNYQEQNKNYEAIFNRQIENMDVNHRYERIDMVAQKSAGVLSGAASGAGTGALIGAAGGPIGAGVGAVVGAVGGIIAGGADIAIGESKYKESKSYATDLHALQLDNVRAMPKALSRTTAFNVDNRYCPVLVLYRCTSDETIAVTEFIRNRSMSLGVISRPENYINNNWNFGTKQARGFMSGSIIQIDTIHDAHFVDELNNQFSRGFYLR